MKFAAIVALGLTAAASARPSGSRMMYRRQALENGQDAIALNEGFKNLQEGSPCTDGENACIGDRFAQCVGGAFASQACAPGTICAALPLVNSRGTSITCTTPDDVTARIGATGAQAPPPGEQAPPPPQEEAPPPPPAEGGNDGGNNDGGNNDGGNNGGDQAPPDGGVNNNGEGGAAGNDGGNNGGGDPQTSLTLDPGVISNNFANDGQDVPADGQVPSLTSTNNFINFCLGQTLTNGEQNRGGSCNTAPIGMIPSVQNMPASKFENPKNGDVINGAKQPFTIVMNIARMETGSFVNAQQNYFAAPQQLNGQGQIIGHSHVVIELLSSLESTDVPDPNVFAFFKGVNTPAQGGQLTAEVNEGLDAGAYRLCSINAAANHQPIIVPVAQHGMIDDCVYFTVAA